MTQQVGVGARLGLSGNLECKDKDGKVLKVIKLSGSIPLSDLGITEEQVKSIINQSEQDNGTDHRQ